MKIFITQRIPESGINLLKAKGFNCIYNDSKIPLSKKNLIEKISSEKFDGILCLLTDKIDKEIIDVASEKGVKCFSNYAVGYNNIEVEYARTKDIKVTNTPDVLTTTTAEMAWALLFSCARRITEAHEFMLEKNFQNWEATLFLGFDISNKTLGIIGAGRIGEKMGLMSKGFSMEVLYTDISENINLETEVNAKKVELDYLLRNSDFISIHVPLNKATHHLLSKKELKLMKNTAILINTSRGSVINEKDLTEILQNKEIAYAGLDVFEKEPFVEESLLKSSNVVLCPHIASATIETRNKMSNLAARNLIEVLQNKDCKNIVNF